MRVVCWLLGLLAWSCLSTVNCLGESGYRVSTWYWLNSVPNSHWEADFKEIHRMGCTDVVLVWGLDAAAFLTRQADSHQAIHLARKEGLGSYLFVWHARHSALPHQEAFEQKDAAGHALFAFDAFDPAWRQGQWKRYLQTLARAYGHEPGFAGYIFDNSFAIGRIGSIDGAVSGPDQAYLSYGSAERSMFGRQPPVSPQDPDWQKWTEAREQWWADWARDTVQFLRRIDPDRRHRIVLEDGENTIDPETGVRAGLKLSKVTASFDEMCAYWAPDYSGSRSTDLGAGVADYLGRMRAEIGPGKDLSLTLRLSDDTTEALPGHAQVPTIGQVEALLKAARHSGVKRIDLYGYRMGIYHLSEAEWHHFLPGTLAAYPLTGEIQGKFLADRPELREPLGLYLKQKR